MGLQGPLTAQALGRSPYDDVVPGEEKEDGHVLSQRFDHRGRPINPETKRINRDIIRSHNEVMLVVGVAEPDNPNETAELLSKRAHESYEESMGMRLATAAKLCVDAVGIFGIHGLRQRVLIYKTYSHIPFWELAQFARGNFSFRTMVLAGAPASFLCEYTEMQVARLWFGQADRAKTRRWVHEVWSWFKVHLQLYGAFQRLGLISSNQLLPPPTYFIPFTQASPIPPPPPLQDFSASTVTVWAGRVLMSAIPFAVWVMMQRLVRDWKPAFWSKIIRALPSTMSRGRPVAPSLPPTPTAIPPPPPPAQPGSEGQEVTEPTTVASEQREDDSPPTGEESSSPADPTGSENEASRQANEFSTGVDDYASDEDDHEVPTTMISFDVEATESADVPQGLWSAELRPSVAPGSRASDVSSPWYLETMLTKLPALIASKIFTDAAMRIVILPYEATALRLAARAYRMRQGLPFSDIYRVSITNGLNATTLTNLLAAEVLHLVLSADVWATFTAISEFFHMSEQEWEEIDGDEEATD